MRRFFAACVLGLLASSMYAQGNSLGIDGVYKGSLRTGNSVSTYHGWITLKTGLDGGIEADLDLSKVPGECGGAILYGTVANDGQIELSGKGKGLCYEKTFAASFRVSGQTLSGVLRGNRSQTISWER